MAKTKIGGQAVMEGVMMRGATSMALCVRDDNGVIRTDAVRLPAKKPWYRKVPIIRGIVNMVVSLVSGMKITMKSAEVAIEDEIDTSDKGFGGYFVLSLILGFALAIGLFIVLPTTLTNGLMKLFSSEAKWLRSLLEGVLKFLILVGYMLGISQMQQIKRVFMYHGAEHKTIACYESELPLTVENVRKCSRYHDRCGTSFIVFVVVLSILLAMVLDAVCYAVGFDQIALWYVRVPIKIALLPLVAGISYEMLMLLAQSNFFLFVPLKWLGKQFQKLTTREPDDSMIEVAVAAFEKVLEMDADQTVEEVHFPEPVPLKDFKEQVKPLLDFNTMEKCDLDWILCAVLHVERKDLRDDLKIPFGWQVKIEKYVKQCAAGEPLQYVIGNTDFYGRLFYVDKNVLIPRPETELVCEQAIKLCRDGDSVLDLCCGSGAIGVTIAAETKAKVTCVDVSKDALIITKYNAKTNKVGVKCVHSNMFSSIKGKFDLVVCNPPYVATDVIETLDKKVKDYEPKQALDGGKDGLDFYRVLTHNIKEHLSARGALVMEIGFDQGQSVKEMFLPLFESVEVKKDYASCDRIVICTKLK